MSTKTDKAIPTWGEVKNNDMKFFNNCSTLGNHITDTYCNQNNQNIIYLLIARFEANALATSDLTELFEGGYDGKLAFTINHIINIPTFSPPTGMGTGSLIIIESSVMMSIPYRGVKVSSGAGICNLYFKYILTYSNGVNIYKSGFNISLHVPSIGNELTWDDSEISQYTTMNAVLKRIS